MPVRLRKRLAAGGVGVIAGAFEVGEIGNGGHGEFAGDGPEAEEDADEIEEDDEPGFVAAEVLLDDVWGQGEADEGDEDELADAEAAGGEEADGEAHGPGDAIGAREDVPLADGKV